jgi:hypothetical protein
MRDRRLTSKAKLKAGQMQNRAQEDLIENIASSADSIDPKVSWRPMLIEHRPSHQNWSAVYSFHNSILLRHTRGRKPLINTMLKIELIKRNIPELSPIVTVNSF